MSLPVIAHFDGCCEPSNPGGYACGGWIVLAHKEIPAEIVGCRAYCHGDGATNNVAEYEAALDALRAVYRTGYRGPVLLRGDSQLVVKQFSGAFSCNAPNLQPLLHKLRAAAQYFAGVTLEWIPRTQNERADSLSRRAYYQARRSRS